MSGLVVRFDEELSVAHRIAEGALPCPRGVLVAVTERRWWSEPNSRNGRVVKPCALTFGHNGDCTTEGRPKGWRTACGLSLNALPFVPSPSGMPPCPDCFDTDNARPFVDDVLDFGALATTDNGGTK